MTEEAQRIAIAEACGKHVLKSCGNADSDHDFWETDHNSIGAWVRYCRRCDASRVCSIHGHDTFWRIDEDSEKFEEIKAPDYLHDLNAMAEAEKILDSHDMDTRSKWLDLLAVTCEWPKTRNAADLRFETHYLIARSTAAQRAEAFLKTLGLWKSSDTSQTPTPTQ